MGHNATLVVMGDGIGEIEADPDFGKKVAAAYREMQMNPGRRIDIACGNNANPAHLVEFHHSDSTVLVAVGGNLGTVQVQVPGGNHKNPLVQEELLKAMARKLGYDLVRTAPVPAGGQPVTGVTVARTMRPR